MLEYPKIDTLYERDQRFKVDASKPLRAEFALVNAWVITEKVDGTNLRIGWFPLSNELAFKGREDLSQVPVPLERYLRANITPALLRTVFGDKDAVVFVEGYGAGINKGDGYRPDVAVRVFDVWISGLWLSLANVADVAAKLGLPTCPVIGCLTRLPQTKIDLMALVGRSLVAREDGGNAEQPAEGIVARTEPLLLRRNGERLMWKLKFRDFK